MTNKQKKSDTRQYTVGLNKQLRSPVLKALALEMQESGEHISINSLVSELVRLGIKTKYPQVLNQLK